MKTFKGYMEISNPFNYAIMNVDDYIRVYNLKTHDVLRNGTTDKYVRTLTITRTASVFTINVVYEDGTTESGSGATGSDIATVLDLLFGSIKTVGYVDVESSNTFLVASVGRWITDYSVNAIFFYKLNSPKNKVDKSLTWVKSDYVKYTRPIQHKQVILDIKESIDDAKYNYVYLSVLNRYYYVTDKIMTNDLSTITLSEDVLMSFSDLIRLQTAFVERNENTYDDYLVDNLVTYDFDKEIEIVDLVPYVTIFPTTDLQESTRDAYILTVVSTI